MFYSSLFPIFLWQLKTDHKCQLSYLFPLSFSIFLHPCQFKTFEPKESVPLSHPTLPFIFDNFTDIVTGWTLAMSVGAVLYPLASPKHDTNDPPKILILFRNCRKSITPYTDFVIMKRKASPVLRLTKKVFRNSGGPRILVYISTGEGRNVSHFPSVLRVPHQHSLCVRETVI
jgi:hypothetical protein